MNKYFAFTLAETLIVLVIVSIISALTIPVFVANMHGSSYRTRLIKTISNLAKASTANYAISSYDFSGANGYYGDVGSPSATYSTPGGALDGSVFGFETQPFINALAHSDLHSDTTSLFHIFKDNLTLRNSVDLTNYSVNAVDILLNCAGRAEAGKNVELDIKGNNLITSATVKTNFETREFLSKSVIQGSGGLADMCNGRAIEQGGFNQGRMFMFADGAVFTYDASQAYCVEDNPCYGYIDVNGPEAPNRVIACSEGEDSYITTYGKNANPGMVQGSCTVKATDITDIYPVLFYNQSVKPASWAAKAVYLKIKSNQVAPQQVSNVE